MQIVVWVLGASLAVLAAACGGKSEPPAGGGGDAAAVMPAACDKLATAYRACIEKLPAGARLPAKDGLQQMQNVWAGGAREPTERACQAALDGAKDSLGKTCPDVRWE